MTSDSDAAPAMTLSFDSEALDGHTVEELSEYLDRDRTPRDPHIEASPGCLLVLDSLSKLHQLSPELLAADIAAEPDVDESWMSQILAEISRDARAGRRIPLTGGDDVADLGITEGAVRGLIRGADAVVPGALIGRSVLVGDVTDPDAEVTVELDVSVRFGHPIPELVNRLRTEVAARLSSHTDLHVQAIDVTVHDVRGASAHEREE